jgi:PhzF family phenazine biosynthesis protein
MQMVASIPAIVRRADFIKIPPGASRYYPELPMSVPITQVDAFTDRPFRGNPAAVCVLDRDVADAWMRDVASEMNLSETAFLRRQGAGAEFHLRWFTPAVEVDLCGHATLAAAHVLWEDGLVGQGEPIRFSTRSGILIAKREGDRILLDFPAIPVTPVPVPDALGQAIDAPIVAVGSNGMDLLVELEDTVHVRALRPDFRKLRDLRARGIIVTARDIVDPTIDFVSRFFAPSVGIDEDPVTGSAHCALGPYWGAKLGKDVLFGYQASPRGGRVEVRLNGDRVTLAGTAVTVLRGELCVEPVT